MVAPASLIALDGHAIVAPFVHLGGWLSIENLAEPIVGGRSGTWLARRSGDLANLGDLWTGPSACSHTLPGNFSSAFGVIEAQNSALVAGFSDHILDM